MRSIPTDFSEYLEEKYNENCNGLFRRYFPKGTDFAKISSKDIEKVKYLINTRPRKRFNGKTPAEMFYEETGVALFSWMYFLYIFLEHFNIALKK